MKIEALRKKLTDAGYVIALKEEITADEKDGIKHFRLPLHRIEGDGSVVMRKVGYWHDTTGRLGTAGDVYPDKENGDFAKGRVLPEAPGPDLSVEVRNVVRNLPEVLGIRSVLSVDGCFLVRAIVQRVPGEAGFGSYVVHGSTGSFVAVPLIGDVVEG